MEHKERSNKDKKREKGKDKSNISREIAYVAEKIGDM